MQTSALELQPLLSEECPPFCLGSQVGGMSSTFADGRATCLVAGRQSLDTSYKWCV